MRLAMVGCEDLGVRPDVDGLGVGLVAELHEAVLLLQLATDRGLDRDLPLGDPLPDRRGLGGARRGEPPERGRVHGCVGDLLLADVERTHRDRLDRVDALDGLDLLDRGLLEGVLAVDQHVGGEQGTLLVPGRVDGHVVTGRLGGRFLAARTALDLAGARGGVVVVLLEGSARGGEAGVRRMPQPGPTWTSRSSHPLPPTDPPTRDDRIRQLPARVEASRSGVLWRKAAVRRTARGPRSTRSSRPSPPAARSAASRG